MRSGTQTSLVIREGEVSCLGLVPSGERVVSRIPSGLLALVPKPTDNVDVVKGKDPDPIKDTVPLMMKLARRQMWQGKKLAERLRGNTITETARNFWNFIFTYIQYKEDGKNEVVKSLRKLIHSGSGDCDCFTNTLSNLLLNAGIPHFFRVAKYNGSSDYSHIYIVIPRDKNMATDTTGNMKSRDYITLDCVPHRFNYEAPFTDHKDFAMKLIALDGLGCGACGCKSTGRLDPATEVQASPVYVSENEVYGTGLVKTSTVLKDAGITTTIADSSTVALTPKGDLVKVPEFIQANDTQKFISDVKTFTPPIVTDTPSTESSKTVTASADATNPITPTKASGGFLLALLGSALALGAMRPSKPTGLSGTPTRSKKQLEVLHM